MPSQRSKSLERETENEKEIPKIPIEYYDERDHGCGADNQKGRVVYRGYAPKNTYFYLKTLKRIKFFYWSIENSLSKESLEFKEWLLIAV